MIAAQGAQGGIALSSGSGTAPSQWGAVSPPPETSHAYGQNIPVFSLLLATLTINILSLALPVLTLQVYDRILPNPGTGTLYVLTAGICVAIVMETVLRLGRSYMIGWAGASFEHKTSCRAMEHILSADLARARLDNIALNVNRMAAIGRLRDFYNGYSLTTLFELAFVPLFLLLIVYIAGPLSLIPTVVLMVFTVITLIQGKNLRAELQERDARDDRRYNFLIETLEGIHTIKSFALENIFTRRYEHLEEQSTFSNYNVIEKSSKTFNTGAVFTNIMIATVIIAGAYFVLQGGLTTGALIATILLSGRIMQPVQKALSLWARYQDFTLSKEKLDHVLSLPPHVRIKTDHEDPDNPSPARLREGTMTWDSVSFYTPSSDKSLLKDISFSLKRGECVSIESANDLAQNAFLDLMAGLYTPDRGTITLDQTLIAAYPSEDLVHHVGYIQREGVIFRGTIRDNLTCFGRIEENRVREICTLLELDQDISAMPSGYDTFLTGTHADIITPGIKQKICVTRTLAPRPRLIVFDHADRALDRNGYNRLYNLLLRLKGKATLVIASDDNNLTSHATRRLMIAADGTLSDTPVLQSIHAAPFPSPQSKNNPPQEKYS